MMHQGACIFETVASDAPLASGVMLFDLVTDDAPHAFYIGVELGRAQIAWQLGKNYMQDEELDWGVCSRKRTDEQRKEDLKATHNMRELRKKTNEYKDEGSTLKASRNRKRKK